MSTLYVDNLAPNLTSAVHATGHVIGVAHAVSSTFSTNSTGNTLIVQISYTAKVTGSKLMVTGMSPRYQNNSSTGTWHSSAATWLTQDGVVKASFEHVGTQSHSGEACENVPISYLSDAVTAGTTYVFGVYHSPVNNGTSTWYFGRNVSGGDAHTRITVMEIAQ